MHPANLTLCTAMVYSTMLFYMAAGSCYVVLYIRPSWGYLRFTSFLDTATLLLLMGVVPALGTITYVFYLRPVIKKGQCMQTDGSFNELPGIFTAVDTLLSFVLLLLFIFPLMTMKRATEDPGNAAVSERSGLVQKLVRRSVLVFVVMETSTLVSM